MKSIGVVICNYNKCDYVIKCIQTVIESKFQDFDIYVVDNASSDSSVERIKVIYGNRVNLLINNENLGGSGGFNTGICKVVEAGYEYLMCLDNDVMIDEDAIETLFTFLKMHPKVGMLGSKVYHMNSPQYIQQFGLNIDFEHFCAETLYADALDSVEIPEIVYCDTVAACSVMLPVKVVKEVSLLPEDNFIYWDDMEWGYLIKRAGFQIAAYGKSKVLHEMGAFVRRDTPFMLYYHWRNCINFFLRYTPVDKLDSMSVRLLSSLFYEIYTRMYRNEHSHAKTLLYAYQDAISNIRGKAMEGKIIPFNHDKTDFIRLIEQSNSFWLFDVNNELADYIQNINPYIKNVDQYEQAQLRIRECDDIMKVSDFSLKYCYIDTDYNIAATTDDLEVIKNYSYSLQLFHYMHQPQFLYAAKQLRNK